MKRSSKNRLTPVQQGRFDPHTLFGKVARAVCRVGTLPRKELYEAWETARRIRRRFRGGRVLDLACGHGLLAHIMILLDDSSPNALAVDLKIPSSARTLSEEFIRTWPRLSGRIQFRTAAIESIRILPSDMVVSVHACGSLTDQVLELAAASRANVAVLPCCHDFDRQSSSLLRGWMDPSLAMDTLRAVALQSKGYQVFTSAIPLDITPKNRLLMGRHDGDTGSG